jgi:hypothetical protein
VVTAVEPEHCANVDALFREHEANAAVRVADLKLVRQGRSGPSELYNLKTDRAHVKPYPSEGKAKKKSKRKKAE